MTTIKDIKAYKKNSRWIEQNLDNLIEKYDGKYIAVLDQKVIEHGDTVKDVRGDDNRYIQFIESDPKAWLL